MFPLLLFFFYLLCAAEIRYNLTLDALRAKARASFIDSDDKSDRRLTRSISIKDRMSKCVQEKFMMSASTQNCMFSPQHTALKSMPPLPAMVINENLIFLRMLPVF